MVLIHVSAEDHYNYDKGFGLVVVKYGAEWCGPCKRFEPYFEKMSRRYPDITFLSVDVDIIPNHEDVKDIRVLPTFKFFIDGELQMSFGGANEEKFKKHIEDLIDLDSG